MSDWEPDDRFDDEMREQREIEHQHRCAMLDIAQGIGSLPADEEESND